MDSIELDCQVKLICCRTLQFWPEKGQVVERHLFPFTVYYKDNCLASRFCAAGLEFIK